MLYDNAQLASLYLQGWLASATRSAAASCEETLDYVLRDMTDPAGGFYSAAGRRLRGRRGQVLRLDAGRDRARCSGPTPTRVAGLLGRRPRAELRGPEHPRTVRRRAAGSRAASRADRGRTAATRRASSACTPGATTRCSPPGTASPARACRGGPRARARRLHGRRRAATPSSSWARCAVDGRLLRTWKDGQAQLNGYLEDYAMVAAGAARRLRGDVRPALARRGARARRRHAAALLGRRAGGLLRHRARRTSA